MSRARDIADLSSVSARLDTVGGTEGALSNRNLIINGAMQVAQRGASVNSSSGSVVYCVDRMVCFARGAGAATFSQDTDTPSGQGFGYSLKADVTTADTSLSGNDLYLIDQRLEGQNLQQLAKGTSGAKQITVSFWVKSSKTGTHILELFDDDNTRQIGQAYTVSSADTWEYKALTFAGDTSGVLDNDNSKSFTVRWFLAAGTDYTSGTLNTSWAANTNANRAVGQVNVMDNTANNFYLTGVQLEVGDTATDFEHRSYGDELQRCFRYYEQWDIVSGENIFIGTSYSGQPAAAVKYVARKRASPTVTIPTAGQTSGTISFLNGTGGYPTTTGTNAVGQVNVRGLRITGSGYSGISSSQPSVLYSNGTTTFKFDAEL
jgi:hypothetical protein